MLLKSHNQSPNLLHTRKGEFEKGDFISLEKGDLKNFLGLE